MDDRQRQFAQFATALNQYTNSNSGNGDRGSRERSVTDGRSSTGSTSSGSSNSSGNAAAALWSDLSRAFQLNYSGFPSGSGWPPPSHQGGSDFHRGYGYGGFNEGGQDNRVAMEGRAEGRRVPSKGETKATPPLPPGLSPNVAPMGSALASLQQLVGIPNDDVYRTLLAQQYAAALSALPPNTRPSISPIPPAPSSHSALSPNQLHGGPLPQRHQQQQHHHQHQHQHHQQHQQHQQQQHQQHQHQQHQQQQQQQQQQHQQQQQQQQHQQQQQQQQHQQQLQYQAQHQQQQMQRPRQPKSSPPLSLLSTVGGNHSLPPAPSPDNGSLNGEYLDPMGRVPGVGLPPQMSPLSRKEGRLTGEHPSADPLQTGHVRHSPSTLPPKSSISPGNHPEADREHHYNSMYDSDKTHHNHPVVSDHGARSGSESEGDQRVRHKRKQDQPRRQTVIYPNTGHPGHSLPPGAIQPPNACHPSSISAESSSDDSQGYDSHLTRPPNHAPSPGEPLRNSSPMIPLDGGAGGSQLPISQAMSHALSHPFLAAHLNAFVPPVSKSDPASFPSGDYDVTPSPTHQPMGKEQSSHYEDPSMKPHNNVQFPPSHYAKGSSNSKGSPIGFYHSDHSPDKEFRPHQHSPQIPEPKGHFGVENMGKEVADNSHYEDKVSGLHYGGAGPHFNNRTPKGYCGYGMGEASACDKDGVTPELPYAKTQSKPPRIDSPSEGSEGNKEHMNHRVEGPQGMSGSPVEKSSPPPVPQSTSEPLVTNSSSNVLPSCHNEPRYYDLSSEPPRASAPPLESPKPSPPPSHKIVDDTPGQKVQDDARKGDASLSSYHDLDSDPRSEDVLVNGTSSPLPPKVVSHDRVAPEEVVSILNGHLGAVVSPGRKQKKRTDCEKGEGVEIPGSPPPSELMGETKRRTRQKRPVSYVEDETDPVLETGEDFAPLLSPARKRGRKGREETPPKYRGFSSPNCLADNSNRTTGVGEELPPEIPPGDRLLQLSHKVPSSLREPLHIDTNIRSTVAQPGTPTLNSPDIYDFNDSEGDGNVRGGKGKRGRKRGSPKKHGRATPEYLHPSLSPRVKEGTWSPRSPKFFRSPHEGSGEQRLENQEESKCSRDINGPTSCGRKTPSDIPNPALSTSERESASTNSTSSVVDEVEAQLAALHKEAPPKVEEKLVSTLKGNLDKGSAPSPPVHKPMLSVVPLEQLTYEGLRNRSKSPTDPLCLDSSHARSPCVDPLGDLNTMNSDGQFGIEDKDCIIEVEAADPLRLDPLGPEPNLSLSRRGFRGRRGPRGRGRAKEPCLPLLGEEFPEHELDPLKGVASGAKGPRECGVASGAKGPRECGAPVDSQVIDRVVASIPVLEPSVHMVSVSEVSSPVFSQRGTRSRKRGVGRGRGGVAAPVEVEASDPNPPPPPPPPTPPPAPPLAVGGETSNGTTGPKEDEVASESPPKLRRSRRGTNQRIETDSSPTSPARFTSPGTGEDSEELFDNRVPPSHDTLESDMTSVQPANGAPPTVVSSSPRRVDPSEGETLEDIAKFLEATAPETKSPTKAPPPVEMTTPPMESSGGSSMLDVPTSSSSGGMDTPYREGRPKRVSRPPPEMGDGEVNDLLLLLNMEGEESEDEDYIPLGDDEGVDEDEDGGEESEDHKDDNDDDSDYGASVGASASLPRKKPIPHKKRPPAKKGTISKKGSKALPQGKGEGEKRKEDLKRKSEDRGDRRGPIIRIPRVEDAEVLVNAPGRDEEDSERTKRLAASFHLDLEMGSSTRTKVGFNSTLHAHYDAFNKDLSWFCAFCKNYSHYRTLGDLFGPFYIKGLTLVKKAYPEVVEGQVPDMAFSPMHSSGQSHSSRQKNKRTPKHDGVGDSLESKRLEIGGCSPPSRFVPSATPARMLGRGGATPNSPRAPWHSPLRGSSSQSGSAPSTASTPKGNLSSTPGETSVESNPLGTECWLHETCTLWASGITAVNSKLCGLEEAVLSAQESICNHCGETGATVCCLGRGCTLVVHVPCSRLLLWSLNTDSFQSFCPKHLGGPSKSFGNNRKGGNSQYAKKS